MLSSYYLSDTVLSSFYTLALVIFSVPLCRGSCYCPLILAEVWVHEALNGRVTEYTDIRKPEQALNLDPVGLTSQ